MYKYSRVLSWHCSLSIDKPKTIKHTSILEYTKTEGFVDELLFL